jgi:hypothetical protein
LCASTRSRIALRDPLLDPPARDRAVGADVVGLEIVHSLEDRLADLHRIRKELALDAPRAIVPGAALDRIDRRAGNPFQHLACLLADVLHARMAGNVIADLAELASRGSCEQSVAFAQDEVFERVEHRAGDDLHIVIVGEQQRQFLLEHQRARRDRSQDRAAGARGGRQHRDVPALQRLDAREVADLELRHAAAHLLLDQHVRHLRVGEQPDEVVTDARLVVVDVARGEDRDLARRAFAVADGPLQRRPDRRAEARRRVRRQPCLLGDAEHALHHLAHRRGRIGRVDRLHDDGDRRQPADGVGARQQPIARRQRLVAEPLRLRAQHQVGEVDVPWMRRNVRAFRHVADVAQVALVDHFPVVGLRDAVDFHRLAVVDEIEQRRKRATQRDAPPAPMADVEDALLLGLQRILVVELGVVPVERVPGRRLQVAFVDARHCSGLRGPPRDAGRTRLVVRGRRCGAHRQ